MQQALVGPGVAVEPDAGANADQIAEIEQQADRQAGAGHCVGDKQAGKPGAPVPDGEGAPGAQEHAEQQRIGRPEGGDAADRAGEDAEQRREEERDKDEDEHLDEGRGRLATGRIGFVHGKHSGSRRAVARPPAGGEASPVGLRRA